MTFPLTRSRSRARFFGVPFTPASLFLNGEQGAWYDPSDFGPTGSSGVGTLFQDAAGTTPVTAVEQAVGLMLDKSKGLVLGQNIQNGGFDTDTVWTKNGWVISGGTASYATGAGAAIEQASPVTLAVGNTVKVTVTVSAIPSGFVYAYVAGTNISSLGATATRTNTPGTYTWYFPIATVTNQNVGILCGNGPVGIVIDNLSIQLLPGNHAFQSTGTSRPILSARRNWLVGTDTLATQTVQTLAIPYVLSFFGTGSITLSGTATGTLNGTGVNTRVYVDVTPTAGNLTLTVSGTVTNAQLEFANEPA